MQTINNIKERAILGRKKAQEQNRTPFSERIALLRKSMSLTMTLLAQKTGLSPSYISLLESGERQPSREVVIKLAQAFFKPDDLNAIDELLMLAGLSPIQTEKITAAHDIFTAYEALLEKQPEDFRTFSAYARALLKAGEHEKARLRINQGLGQFTGSYQLQALLAQLELSLGHYEAAIAAQQSAMEQFKIACKRKWQQSPDYADLLINLGVAYFLWGYDAFSRYVKAVSQKDKARAPHEKKQAVERFRQAAHHYEQAQAIAPGDIYLLDEYARVCFNLADLGEESEKERLWSQAIQALKNVILADNSGAIGIDSLREINAFLAHALAKSGRFGEAETAIGIIRSLNPGYWLIYYVQACFYNLRYGQEKQEELLDLALASLKRAIAVEDPANQAASEALLDLDLQALRAHRAKEFMGLIDGGKENK